MQSGIVGKTNPNYRTSCKKCGYTGHLTFQCRNFLKIDPNKDVVLDVSSTSSESDEEFVSPLLQAIQKDVLPESSEKKKSKSKKRKHRSQSHEEVKKKKSKHHEKDHEKSQKSRHKKKRQHDDSSESDSEMTSSNDDSDVDQQNRSHKKA